MKTAYFYYYWYTRYGLLFHRLSTVCMLNKKSINSFSELPAKRTAFGIGFNSGPDWIYVYIYRYMYQYLYIHNKPNWLIHIKHNQLCIHIKHNCNQMTIYVYIYIHVYIHMSANINQTNNFIYIYICRFICGQFFFRIASCTRGSFRRSCCS